MRSTSWDRDWEPQQRSLSPFARGVSPVKQRGTRVACASVQPTTRGTYDSHERCVRRSTGRRASLPSRSTPLTQVQGKDEVMPPSVTTDPADGALSILAAAVAAADAATRAIVRRSTAVEVESAALYPEVEHFSVRPIGSVVGPDASLRSATVPPRTQSPPPHLRPATRGSTRFSVSDSSENRRDSAAKQPPQRRLSRRGSTGASLRSRTGLARTEQHPPRTARGRGVSPARVREMEF